MNDKETLYRNINTGIIEERFPAFSRNLNGNIESIRKHGGLRRIIPFFKGKNVVIVGAGPTLEENIKLLASVAGRPDIEIISADMALKPLAAGGVNPGYVISCETIPADFFGGVKTAGIHLLAFSCMSAINLRKWKGGVSFFNWMLEEPRFSSLWEKAGSELGFLATGSIVTTQAVSFALGCGVSSIALLGNDLGFRSSYHTRNSLGIIKSINESNRISPVSAVQMNYARGKREYEIKRDGRRYYTSKQFLAAKMWLEELFSGNRVPVYDCCEPGCSGKFVIKTDFGRYLDAIQPIRKKRGRRR